MPKKTPPQIELTIGLHSSQTMDSSKFYMESKEKLQKRVFDMSVNMNNAKYEFKALEKKNERLEDEVYWLERLSYKFANKKI